MWNICRWIFFVALITILTQACATLSCSQVHNAVANAPMTPQANTNFSKVGRAIKADGWEIPGLAGSKQVSGRGVLIHGDKDFSPIHWTFKQPAAQEGREFVFNDDYFTDGERKELGLLPGEYGVMKIIEYDINERAFCYAIWIHPVGIGAMSELHYYDEDGDGKFETLERQKLNPLFVPRVPASAQ